MTANPTDPAAGDLAAQIQRLTDVEAIKALKHRYASLVDEAVRRPSRANALAVAALFTDDAAVNYGPLGSLRGRDQVAHHYEVTAPSQLSWVMHLMTNAVIDVDGARATGAWYFNAFAVFKGGPAGGPVPVFGRYHETYVRTPEGWRFSAMAAAFDDPSAPA